MEKATVQSDMDLLDQIFDSLDEFSEPDVEYSDYSSSTHFSRELIEHDLPSGFISGLDLYQLKSEQKTLTTGCDSIDDILYLPQYGSFGLRLGETYEIAGESRSGKTQLLHQLAITCQLPSSAGGIGREVIYIDAERSFSPARLLQITKRFSDLPGTDLTSDELLAGINLAQPRSSGDLLPILQMVKQKVKSSPDRYGLIIIDTITGQLRGEYRQDKILERQQHLQQILNILSHLASNLGVAVVVSNQVQYQPQSDETLPIGGHVMGHWAHHRILLSCLSGNHRSFRLLDSPIYPETTTRYCIEPDGIVPITGSPQIS